MSVNINNLLSPAEIHAKRERIYDRVRERVTQKISHCNTEGFSAKFKNFIIFLVQVTIPLVGLGTCTIPLLMSVDIAWLPFAGAGLTIVMVIILVSLENGKRSREKQEKAYKDFEGMLQSPHPQRFCPITNVDLPYDDRWFSDIFTDDKNEQGNRVSPRSLHRYAGTRTPLPADVKKVVYDLEAPLSIRAFAVGGIAGLGDSLGLNSMRESIASSSFLRHGNLAQTKEGIRSDFRESVLSFGETDKTLKARIDFANQCSQCSDEEREWLKRLDKIESAHGEKSPEYLNAEREFLALSQHSIEQKKRGELNDKRSSSLKDRYPFYGHELAIEECNLQAIQIEALSRGSAISSTVFGKVDEAKLPVKNSFATISSLINYNNQLLIDLDAAYLKWQTLPPFFAQHNPFVKPLNTIKKRLKTFDVNNLTVERKLRVINIEIQELTAILKQATQEECGQRLLKARQILCACQNSLDTKQKEFDAKTKGALSLEEIDEFEEHKREKLHLDESLRELQKKIEDLRGIKIFGVTERNTMQSLQNELEALMQDGIEPFETKLFPPEEIESFSNSMWESIKIAFFPPKVKIPEPEIGASKIAQKRYVIDGKRAENDYRLNIAFRVNELVIAYLPQIFTLFLSGVFLYLYPNITILLALAGITFAISLISMSMKYWISEMSQEKRELRMKHFMMGHVEGLPFAPSCVELKKFYDLKKRNLLDATESVDGLLREHGKLDADIEKKRKEQEQGVPDIALTFDLLKKTKEEFIAAIPTEEKTEKQALKFLKSQYALIIKHIHTHSKIIERVDKEQEAAAIKKESYFKVYEVASGQRKQEILKKIEESILFGDDPALLAAKKAIRDKKYPSTLQTVNAMEKALAMEEDFKDFTLEKKLEDMPYFIQLNDFEKKISRRESLNLSEETKREITPFAIKELKEAAEKIIDQTTREEVLNEIAVLENRERETFLIGSILKILQARCQIKYYNLVRRQFRDNLIPEAQKFIYIFEPPVLPNAVSLS